MFISIELSEYLLYNKKKKLSVFCPHSWETAAKSLAFPTSNTEVCYSC